MKINLLKLFTLSIFVFLTGVNLQAQARIKVYTDLSHDVFCDGLLLKSAGLANIELGKVAIEVGCQFDFKNNRQITYSGFTFKLSREFKFGDYRVAVLGFYDIKPFSSILKETNCGFLSGFDLNHFKISLGADFRTFSYTQKAIRVYEFSSNTKIREIWNLIYSFSYYIKPLDHPWNIAFIITDIDNFLIEHETNPILNLQASFKLNSRINFFTEVRYKNCWPFNLNFNCLGYSIRTGLIFSIS